MAAGLPPFARRRTCPPLILGIAVALFCILVETLIAAGLRHVISVPSLGIVYLLGIMTVASVWGFWLGMATAVLSALAFDYFLIPPVGGLVPGIAEDWGVLAIFLTVTALAGSISKLARSLAVEVDARAESDLSADLARVFLHAPHVKAAQPEAARLLTRVLGLPYASVESGEVAGGEDRTTFPIHDHGVPVATLVVPSGLPRPVLRRLHDRVVPSMEVLRHAACERERVANEQVALRRLATLVARGVPPGEVFGAVAREVGNVLDAAHVAVVRYGLADTATNVGIWNRDTPGTMPLGASWLIEPGSAGELVKRTGAAGRVGPVRADADASEFMGSLHRMGIQSSVGAPIKVGGHLWGAVVVLSSSGPLPADTEERLSAFTDLVTTAIVNAEDRAKLEASRDRVIAAADATRRLIEHDLHESTQQRLVSLMGELRSVEAAPPVAPDDVRNLLSRAVAALDEVLEDLRGIARGLHPALLSRRGLEPAIKALARGSSVPVTLNVNAADRLSERSAVTAYHVVSEALTNVADHAGASMVHIDLTVEDHCLRLSIRDDGKGGADPLKGKGLLHIRDRVEALGGILEISSPVGGGTTLYAEIPAADD